MARLQMIVRKIKSIEQAAKIGTSPFEKATTLEVSFLVGDGHISL